MKDPVRRWVAIFILTNVVLIQWAGYNDNAASRLATVAAITAHHSFQIDRYIRCRNPWTKDWARGPDGDLYSNKPPLPMLLAAPVFFVSDRFLMASVGAEPATRDKARREKLPLYNALLSFIFQILPFAGVVGLALERLREMKVSDAALHLTAGAMFFGNTAAVLMNLYFGHPLAAWCVLATVLASGRRQWGWAAFFLSLAAFSDYGAIVLWPGFLYVAWRDNTSKGRQLARLFCGAAAPIILGGFYHATCFGRPWRTALQFEAPEFADLLGGSHTYWGIFHVWPRMESVVQLLAGPTRGLLFTQPWVLLVIAAAIYMLAARADCTIGRQPLLIFSVSGFILLLGANACFGQWHGGWTIGPRYMSCIFPTLGFLGGSFYDRAPPLVRSVAWGMVLLSLALAALVFAGIAYVPQDRALWPFLLRYVFSSPASHTLPRIGLLLACWFWAFLPFFPKPRTT